MTEKSSKGKSRSYLITGLIVLVMGMGLIYTSKINVLLFPTSEVGMNGTIQYAGAYKEFVFFQEFPVTKDYLTAIDLVFLSPNQQYRNENTLMLLDTAYTILYQKRFTNEGLGVNRLKRIVFEFPKNILCSESC